MLKHAECHLAELVYGAWDTLLADRPGLAMEVHKSTQPFMFSRHGSDTSRGGASACSFGRQETCDGVEEGHTCTGVPCAANAFVGR